ncbi:YetF domain-containing protein [Lysinibacillus sphaericus]|uniref:YetF domain-containing protein n=1 Tax=Lysinibacillus sphaericus TaxID=1421 RepID=UPI003F7B0439
MGDFIHAQFWEMTLRVIISFFVLLILTRILGKKQLGQLTFFHYTTGISFGSIAAQIASQAQTPFLDALIALIWWGVLTYIMTILTIKSKKARVLIDDKPTIVIQNGLILESGLKKNRLHMDELTMMLRERSIFSVQDVQYAILETNGALSVLQKTSEQIATKQDVKADVSLPTYLPTEVVSDGQLIYENLVELELTEDWLMKKLKKQNVQSVEDVYFAQVQTNGSLYISLKDKARQSSP